LFSTKLTDVAEFTGEVRRTAALEVVEVGDTASVVKARIVIREAGRTVIARYAVCGRLWHVYQCAGLVELHVQHSTKHEATLCKSLITKQWYHKHETLRKQTDIMPAHHHHHLFVSGTWPIPIPKEKKIQLKA